MNAKAIFLFSLALTFIGFSPLQAQRPEDSLYYALGSAYLIVRLPSQENKMKAMEATIANPNNSETSRSRLQAQLEEVRTETQVKNRAIVHAFDRHFDALPVAFVYDTTHSPLQGAFLNEQLQETGTPEVGDVFIQLRFGRPVAYSGSRAESMVLTDSRLQDLGPPFPKPVMMTGFGYGFNKLMAPETAFEKLLEKRVKKLDRKLEVILR